MRDSPQQFRRSLPAQWPNNPPAAKADPPRRRDKTNRFTWKDDILSVLSWLAIFAVPVTVIVAVKVIARYLGLS
jgi:hypothetical protein